MLIIEFLINSFKLYFFNNIDTPDLLNISGNTYLKDETSRENNGFLGFFDWLRISESEIVGIRICFFGHQLYNEILQKHAYVNPTYDGRCMELMFVGNNYNPEFSGDQDFTNNFVYKSGNNNFLFTFGLDHLTESETKNLIKYCEII